METKSINQEDVQGMFFCWTQVSRRMQKSMSEREKELVDWLLESMVHRVIANDNEDAVDDLIRKALAQCDFAEPHVHDFYFDAPGELSSGCIRIWRRGDPKAVINIPIIDWRGQLQPRKA